MDESIDHDGLRTAVKRARALYTAEAHSKAVVEVTEALQQHLRTVIPVCQAMSEQLPVHSLARMRLAGAVAMAVLLLKEGPRGGAMSTVVHMQLLADSALTLAAKVQTRAVNGSDHA